MRYEDTLHDHSVVREGLNVGLLTGLVAAVGLLLGDAVRGRLLSTPNVLGQYLLSGDEAPAAAVDTGAVVGYAVAHFLAFVVIGWIAVWLTHLTVRNSAWRVGIPSIVLTLLVMLLGILPAMDREAGGQIPLWSVALALGLGAVAMSVYLWRTHPVIKRELQDIPLGETQEGGGVRAPRS